MTKMMEIIEIIESVAGCKVRKIRHGDNANHVWFWSPDNASRLGAIREAYKIKNKYEPVETIITNKNKDLPDEQLDRIIEQKKKEAGIS